MDEGTELTAGVTPASPGRAVAAVPGFGELQPAAAASLVQAWRWPSQRPQDGAGTPHRNRREKGSSSLPPAGRAPTNTHPPVRADALALLGEHPPYLPSPGWAAPLGLCAPAPWSLRGADCSGGLQAKPGQGEWGTCRCTALGWSPPCSQAAPAPRWAVGSTRPCLPWTPHPKPVPWGLVPGCSGQR